MRYLQKQFFYAQFLFAILSLILGTLAHFVYEWSSSNYIVGYFFPVNESVWEHLKLLFFPVIILSVFEYFYIGRYFPSFLTSRFIGCILGMAFIPVFYYTYTGILGNHLFWLDFATFFLAVSLCYSITWHRTIKKKTGNRWRNFLSFCFLLFIMFVFFYFSYHPPKLPLFYDSSNVFRLLHKKSDFLL